MYLFDYRDKPQIIIEMPISIPRSSMFHQMWSDGPDILTLYSISSQNSLICMIVSTLLEADETTVPKAHIDDWKRPTSIFLVLGTERPQHLKNHPQAQFPESSSHLWPSCSLLCPGSLCCNTFLQPGLFKDSPHYQSNLLHPGLYHKYTGYHRTHMAMTFPCRLSCSIKPLVASTGLQVSPGLCVYRPHELSHSFSIPIKELNGCAN